MRLFRFSGLPLLLLAGCATTQAAPGPAGIPYACAAGHAARVTYDGGGWFVRARARLFYDGRVIEMRAAPPTYGLRYVTAEDHGPTLVWSARGEEAWLAELADDNVTEREIAHCTRLRGVDAGPEPAGR